MNIKGVVTLWLAGCKYNQKETADIMSYPELAKAIQENEGNDAWRALPLAVCKFGMNNSAAYEIYNKDYYKPQTRLCFLLANPEG